MKKKFIIMAVAIASSLGISSFAQTPANETCNGKKCDKTEKKCDRPCDRPGAFNPFEGINLTADQQAKLNEIQKPCPRKETKAEKMERKQAERAERTQARKDYLANVKAVLTPEQYVQFLENIVVSQPDNKARKMKDGNRDFRKGDRNDRSAMGSKQRPDDGKRQRR